MRPRPSLTQASPDLQISYKDTAIKQVIITHTKPTTQRGAFGRRGMQYKGPSDKILLRRSTVGLSITQEHQADDLHFQQRGGMLTQGKWIHVEMGSHGRSCSSIYISIIFPYVEIAFKIIIIIIRRRYASHGRSRLRFYITFIHSNLNSPIRFLLLILNLRPNS